MTRIENDYSQTAELEGVQDEIEHLKKQLKKKQSKKFFNCTSCLLILIIIFILLGAIFCAIVAKSGLWPIPVFTDYFYHRPEPVYNLTATNFTEADLLNRIKQVAASEAIKQGKTGNLEISFDLTEAEITGLLRNQIMKTESLSKQVDYLQLAVAESQLQLFLKATSPKNLIITLNFVPQVAAGELDFKVKNFKIGDLSLPHFIGSLVIEKMTASALNSALKSLSLLGQIKDIELLSRKLRVKILINNLGF